MPDRLVSSLQDLPLQSISWPCRDSRSKRKPNGFHGQTHCCPVPNVLLRACRWNYGAIPAPPSRDSE